MEQNFTSQEILLVTGTGFAATAYALKEEDKSTNLTPAEKLAEACWNGMLRDRLPEISIIKNKKPLTLWEVGEGKSILYLQLGERDISPEAIFTINPYRMREYFN